MARGVYLILTQVFPPGHGGVEVLMSGLAQALAARGEEVVVFADGGGSPLGREDADGLGTGRSYGLMRFGGPKPLRRWGKARAAAVLSRTRPVEAVLCDSWKSLERYRRGHAPVLCFGHGMELPADPPRGKRARIRRALAKADVVCVNSRFTAGLARPYLKPETELRVTPPPAPLLAEPDPALLARLGAGTRGALVVTLGRLEPRKGVDRLIEACARLRPRHPGLRLRIAGDGEDRSRLAALARACGLYDDDLMLGRVSESEKSALLHAADVFAMPVRRDGDSVEGFGVVYLEAGLAGVPSLAGRDGGSAEAVRDGETGLLCDGADLDAVTDALARLLDDPAQTRRLGEAARAHAEQQTWDALLDAHLPARLQAPRTAPRPERPT